MSDEKACFVIMSIRKKGTDEHRHFLAIYEQAIKPVAEKHGYVVTRADEIQESGNITRDIIVPLARDSLVIADLTDLNPNVFYELGVRHALQGIGTIMLLDTQRTEDVPFDLKPYRFIEYTGDLIGITQLREGLDRYLLELETTDADKKDNPVHDWLKVLPTNILAQVTGSAEEGLRERIADLSKRVARYEKLYGEVEVADSDPIVLVDQQLRDVEEGLLPSDLIQRATRAVEERDAKEFLLVVKVAIERSVELGPRKVLELVKLSETLGLSRVTEALFRYAVEKYPENDDLQQAQLAWMSHSDDPAFRARAREGLMKQLEIGIGAEGEVEIPHRLSRRELALISVLLDTYQRGGPKEEARRIASALVEKYPERSMVLRNYARVLGRSEEALEYYRRAVWCEDADEVSAIWLGNELHNRERHVDAVEAYLLGCLLDPDDATPFAHVTDDLAWALHEGRKIGRPESERLLPEGVGPDEVVQAFRCVISCPGVSASDLERVMGGMRRAGQPIEDLRDSERMGVEERMAFASSLFARFESELTRRPREELS